ncbi:tetratricopeptide repeat protein [bacterium]|nr:tetratricopeptide repeat protein [bacterium]
MSSKKIKKQQIPELSYPTPTPIQERSGKPPAPMITVAWYSYKGGVGRSMCLANVCSILAREGYKVVVLDLDIDAPGLDTVPPFKIKTDTSRGIVGFLSDLIQKKCKLDDIEQYGRILDKQKFGDVFYLRAGPSRISDYLDRLSVIREEGIFKPSSKEGPYYLDQIRQYFADEYKAHYLLIDSRTGFSETGAASTLLLADIVVLVTALNENNLAALNPIMDLIINARPEKEEFAKRIIPAILRASPGETEWNYEAMREAEKALKRCAKTILKIPPWTGAAFRAGSVVFEPWAPADLRDAYRGIAEEITSISQIISESQQLKPDKIKPSELDIQTSAAKALLKEKPKNTIARISYGELLWKKEMHKEALLEMAKASKQTPQNKYVLRKYAYYLTEDDQIEEAEKIYNKLINLIKKEAVSDVNRLILSYAVNNRFILAQRIDSNESARRSDLLEQARDLSDNTLKTYYKHVKTANNISSDEEGEYEVLRRTLAKSYDLLGAKEEAEAVFKATIKILPEKFWIFRDYITFLNNNERHEDLEEILKQAIARNFHIGFTLHKYINLLLRRDSHQQALDLLVTLQNTWGQSALIYLLIGTVLFEAGNKQQAIASLHNSLKLDPDRKDAWLLLAENFWQNNENEKAVEYATELIERFNGDLMGYTIRAEALVDLGRYRDAINDIKEVLSRNEGNIPFLTRAAQAAKEVKDFKLAEKCYKLLLDRKDIDEERRATELARFALMLVKQFPDRSEEATRMIEEANKLAPENTGVVSGTTLVQLHLSKSVSENKLRDVDMTNLEKMFINEGEASGVKVESKEIHEVLKRIMKSKKCKKINRWTAGATLAQTMLDAKDFEKGRKLIVALERMGIPKDNEKVFNNLQLALYGLRESRIKNREDKESKRIEKDSDFINGSLDQKEILTTYRSDPSLSSTENQ